MNNQELPRVVHEGTMNLGGMEIKVLHLSNGQRVITEDELDKALSFLGITKEEMKTILSTGKLPE